MLQQTMGRVNSPIRRQFAIIIHTLNINTLFFMHNSILFGVTYLILYCSQLLSQHMSRKSAEGASAIVSQTLAKTICHIHQAPITHIGLDKLQAGCCQCFPKNGISISQIVDNPIQAVISNQDSKLELRKLLHYVEVHKKVKLGFEALIEQIRKIINKFCDQALQEYRSRWQVAFSEAHQKIEEIRTAEDHYRAVFDQLLQTNFQKGTVFELQLCLNQFRDQCSEDPTDYLNTRVQSWLQSISQMPIIDWAYLKSIYDVLTDSELFKNQNFIRPSSCFGSQKQGQHQMHKDRAVLLIPQVQNKLKKKDYFVKFGKNGIDLLKKQRQCAQRIHRLNDKNDSYYDVGKNRLIGINYQGISFYNYAFDKLIKQQSYKIPACLSILSFPECLIVEAEGRINRLWLNDGFKQVISLSGTDISYTDNPYEFGYKNGKGDTIKYPALHNPK